MTKLCFGVAAVFMMQQGQLDVRRNMYKAPLVRGVVVHVVVRRGVGKEPEGCLRNILMKGLKTEELSDSA